VDYDNWPTVFTYLETHDERSVTTAIADWDVIAAIAETGGFGRRLRPLHRRGARRFDLGQTDDLVGQ
jgi:hypothetical protein